MEKIKIILLILLSGFVVNNSSSQPTWNWKHPLPQGNAVRNAKLFASNGVRMCGNGGMFGRTSNGGNSWYITHQAAGVPTQFQTDLFSFHHFDENNIIACGANATISKTTDGGNNFSLISTGIPTSTSLLYISFINSNTGYACGSFGTVIKSNNGGLNWQIVSPGGSSPINKLFVADENTVYGASSNGTIHFTSNAGMNWSQYSTGTTSTLTDVVFSDANIGIAVGTTGAIRKTTNGGVNWTNSNTGAPTVNWNDIIFHDGEFCIAGGSINIARSTDFGASWQQINTIASGQNATGTLFAIDVLANEMVVGGSSGILNYSSNNGTNWTALGNKLYNGILRDLDFRIDRGSDEIFAVGTYSSTTANSAVMYSSDGGMNWSNSRGNPITTNLNAIEVTPDLSTIYAFGDGGKGFKSVDEGSTWNLLTTGTATTFNGISFINSNTGWAVGNSNLIAKTSNGGDNFTFQNAGTGTWKTVFFLDENTGWVGGITLPLKNTTDGGSTWSLQTTGLTSISHINMLDAQTGFVSGGDASFFGAMKKTTDGGNSWFNITVPEISTSIVSFDIKDDGQSMIIAGAQQGQTAITTNGGNNWTMIFSGSSSINKIKYDDNDDSWLAGSAGNIMKLNAVEFLLDVTSFFAEGFYNAATNITVPDTAKVTLRNFNSPYPKVDSAKKLVDNSGNAMFNFSNVLNGIPYYVVLNHRNSIETWSSKGVTFSSGSASYSFSISQFQAFGNNMKQIDTSPNRWGDYGGDVNQDGNVDASDMISIYNDANNFVSGYVSTDVTGDDFVDATDLILAFNNSINFVSKMTP